MSNDFIEKVAKRLRDSIEQSGLSYKDLEQRTGIAHSSLQRYAAGNIKRLPITNLQRIAAALDVSDAYLIGWSDDPTPRKTDPVFVPVKTDRKKVPLYSAVGAGDVRIADDYVETYIEADGKADFAVRVDGDSMEPTILKGDIVLVRQQSDVENDEIAIVLVEDSAVCKRIVHLPRGIVCVSDNDAYEPFILKDARILGKVVGLHRAF